MRQLPKHCFSVILLMVCLLTIEAHSQIRIEPTPTPPLKRLHYGYEHIPPVNAVEHEDILFSVCVDEMRPSDEMRIHFRKKNDSGFHAITMGYNPASSCFEALVSERFHGNKTLEYYIEIFPEALSPIRIPEVPGEFHSVKMKRTIARYVEPILLMIIVAAPFIGLYVFTQARKGHAKKRAEYERRIRSRRRKLSKEREKHYKEYLKTLTSGTRATTADAEQETQSRLRKPPVQKNKRVPAARVEPVMNSPQKTKAPSAPATEKPPVKKPLATKGFGPNISTDEELRRELDNILNKTEAETVLLSRTQQKPSQSNFSKSKSSKSETKAKPAAPSVPEDDLSDDEKQDLIDLFDM